MHLTSRVTVDSLALEVTSFPNLNETQTDPVVTSPTSTPNASPSHAISPTIFPTETKEPNLSGNSFFWGGTLTAVMGSIALIAAVLRLRKVRLREN